jgi:hypothetical protein
MRRRATLGGARTARTLALALPAPLLARAVEVIE